MIFPLASLSCTFKRCSWVWWVNNMLGTPVRDLSHRRDKFRICQQAIPLWRHWDNMHVFGIKMEAGGTFGGFLSAQKKSTLSTYCPKYCQLQVTCPWIKSQTKAVQSCGQNIQCNYTDKTFSKQLRVEKWSILWDCLMCLKGHWNSLDAKW